MNNRNHLIHAVVCLAMMASASAAPVIWSAPQAISNSAEVVTSGTLVIARQGNSGTSQTVHGVAFDSSNNTQNGVTFSLTGNAEYWSNVFLGTKALAGTDGTAYGNALNGAWYNDGGNMTASLSGLTVGNSYLIQFWVADFRQFTNDRRLTIAGADVTFMDDRRIAPLLGAREHGGAAQDVLKLAHVAVKCMCAQLLQYQFGQMRHAES